MPHTARPEKNAYEPRNPDWEATVRGSFARQKVMRLIGAENAIAPEDVGQYRIRPPLKPIPLAALAALDESAASREQDEIT